MKSRAKSDEEYIVNLCDRVLERKAIRQHTFEFLRGDPGKRSPKGRRLPVDAYYKEINVVIEYRERQHTETVKIFDSRSTCSGCSRGEQRKKYDALRRGGARKTWHSTDRTRLLLVSA